MGVGRGGLYYYVRRPISPFDHPSALRKPRPNVQPAHEPSALFCLQLPKHVLWHHRRLAGRQGAGDPPRLYLISAAHFHRRCADGAVGHWPRVLPADARRPRRVWNRL